MTVGEERSISARPGELAATGHSLERSDGERSIFCLVTSEERHVHVLVHRRGRTHRNQLSPNSILAGQDLNILAVFTNSSVLLLGFLQDHLPGGPFLFGQDKDHSLLNNARLF